MRLDEWPQFAGTAVEGALLADYKFERFQVEENGGPGRSLRAGAGGGTPRRRGVRSAGVKRSGGSDQSRARDRQSARNLLYPEALAEHAQKLGRRYGFKVTVFNEKVLRARQFGGLIAVGQGSVRPPRLIVIEHRGGPKSEAPVALVGKAITFDTGGISIKPAANMEEMIFDKCGGIAVLGAMAALAALGVKRNCRRGHRQCRKYARRQRLPARRYRHDLRRQAHRDR
ncbi:MAG: hypothetical protein WDN28_17640 [Chthoniobacter sp.]